MEKETKISAFVSRATRALLERLPADAIVHPKLVVTRRSGEAILKQTRSGKSTKALRGLMRDAD